MERRYDDRGADPAADRWDAEGWDIGAGLLGESLDDRLARWAAAARVTEAAGGRRRERWLRHQAEEEGSFAGVLVDLAERGVAVTIHAASGRTHHGGVHAVGTDFVVVRPGDGSPVFVASATITSVVVGPGVRRTAGDREDAVSRLSLAGVLAGLCGERERVTVVGRDGAFRVTGLLLAVGRDVVTVGRGDDGRAGTAYLPVVAVGEVAFA